MRCCCFFVPRGVMALGHCCSIFFSNHHFWFLLDLSIFLERLKDQKMEVCTPLIAFVHQSDIESTIIFVVDFSSLAPQEVGLP